MPYNWSHQTFGKWGTTYSVKCLISDFVFLLLKKVTSVIANMNLQIVLCANLVECPQFMVYRITPRLIRITTAVLRFIPMSASHVSYSTTSSPSVKLSSSTLPTN